jgi:hypothetical protein
MAMPLAVLLSVCLVHAPPARAQTTERQEQILEQARFGRDLWLELRERLAGLRIRGEQDFLLGARYDDTDLDWLRSGLAFGGGIPIGSRFDGIAFSLSTAVVDPIVDGSPNILDLPDTDDDPFDPLLDSAFGLGTRFELPLHFDVEINAGLAARHEIGAQLSSALATAGSVALGYRRGEWLRLRLGVGLGSTIERADLKVSPVFRLRVRPVPGVWLETDGTTGRIEWQATPRIELSLFGGVDSKRYRLAKRGPTIEAGSLELAKSEVGLGVRMPLPGDLRLQLQTAVVLGQRITLFDEDRNEIDARDTREPTFGLRLRLAWEPPAPTP